MYMSPSNVNNIVFSAYHNKTFVFVLLLCMIYSKYFIPYTCANAST